MKRWLIGAILFLFVDSYAAVSWAHDLVLQGGMNIVKGVADLFWRTSSPQSGEYGSPSQSGRFAPPTPKIIFRYIHHLLIDNLFPDHNRGGELPADCSRIKTINLLYPIIDFVCIGI